jgi:hypothetical protein
MDTFEKVKPIQKYNGLAVASFVLGLMTVIFPMVSILYLVAANGGAGYFQSLFCGIPVALESVITGIVSLVQIRRKNQKGGWMATLGIVFGVLFSVIFGILAFVLLAPYLFGRD